MTALRTALVLLLAAFCVPAPFLPRQAALAADSQGFSLAPPTTGEPVPARSAADLPGSERLEYALRVGPIPVGRAVLESAFLAEAPADAEFFEPLPAASAAADQPAGPGRTLATRALGGSVVLAAGAPAPSPDAPGRAGKTAPRAARGAARRLVMTAQSTGLAAFFLTVQNRIQSLAAPDLDASLLFEKNIRQGDRRRHYRLRFSPAEVPGAPEDAISVRRIDLAPDGAATERTPLALAPAPLDPLTALHALRLLPVAPGAHLTVDVTDGRKVGPLEAEVGRPQFLKTDAGRFEVLPVLVRMNGVDGVFRVNRVGSFRVWVLRDFPHTPVRVLAAVRVGPLEGTVIADLTTAVPAPPTAPPAPPSTPRKPGPAPDGPATPDDRPTPVSASL